MTWMPRLAPGQEVPKMLAEWYELACSPVYADSGICRHLSYFRSLVDAAEWGVDRAAVVELGMGGGDQSTLAWLSGDIGSLDCYDVNEPPSLLTIKNLAAANGIPFHFHHGSTADLVPMDSDVCFIDSAHNAATVDIELRRFAPLCRKYLAFHDVCSYGEKGQCDEPDQGINLPIARFLYRNPCWRVHFYSEEDNGLLVLRRA